MTKSQRLQPIAKLAERREQEAARCLAECYARLRERQEKLDELLGYREEYRLRYERMASAGMHAGKVQRYLAFMRQLDAAIEHQQGMVNRASRDCEAQRREWTGLHSKTLSLDKAIERMRQDEAHQESRREQRESEDRPPRPGLPQMDSDTR